MRRALVLAIACLALPATAGAALPTPGIQLQGHDHETRGGNWHVQLVVSTKSPHLIDTVVFYAVCGETILETRVTIADTGLFSGHGRIKGGGAWRVDGIFLASDTVLGTARMIKGRCDTGPVPFAALTDQAHQHLTTPVLPDIAAATVRELRQAQAMRRRAWQAGIDPLLIGLMFRVPKGKRPDYAGPIPIYHQHFGTATSAPMTHVWLTNDLTSAWANCAPIPALTAAHPGFRYAGAAPLPHGPGAPCRG